MKGTQLRYALERIDQLWARKHADIRNECTTKGKVMSVADFVAGVRNGKIIAKTDAGKLRVGCRDDNSYYDFPAVDRVFDLEKSGLKAVFDEAEFNKRKKKLDEHVTSIKDELVLGDQDTALKAIEAFAKAKF